MSFAVLEMLHLAANTSANEAQKSVFQMILHHAAHHRHRSMTSTHLLHHAAHHGHRSMTSTHLLHHAAHHGHRSMTSTHLLQHCNIIEMKLNTFSKAYLPHSNTKRTRWSSNAGKVRFQQMLSVTLTCESTTFKTSAGSRGLLVINCDKFH